MSWTILLVPFLIALNAFFVAAEYALVAIKSVQIEQMRAKGKRRAADAMQRLKKDPASAIGAIQVCITLTNLLLGGLGEPPMTALLLNILGPVSGFMSEEIFRAVSITLTFTIVTFLTVVFSELLPKALTLRYVPVVASLTATPVRFILTVTRPIVWLMNAAANLVTRPLGLGSVEQGERAWHTADEIRLIAAEAAQHGELTARERSLILNSLALGRRTARQIMVPRVRVAFLDLQKSMDENRRVMNEHLFSRLPLCNGGIDNVIGIVPTREFLAAYHAEGDSSVLQLIMRPAVFAPSSIPLDKLLMLIDEKKTQMVILVDEHGGTEGLVTLRDVVDELVGQPIDVTHVERVGEKNLYVPGDMPLHEFEQHVGQDLTSESDSVTVGGLITERLGRFPRKGDQIELPGVTLRVVDGDSRVVRRVEVIRRKLAAESA